MTRSVKPTRVAFISPCGFGNLGDVAIQDAFIENIRRRIGDDVEFVGITQNPSDTEMRHGVRAVAMDVEGFRVRSKPSPKSHDDSANEPNPATQTNPVSTPPLAAVIRRTKRVVKELLHWRLALRVMRGSNVLVVSGGGQLDDYWGGPWRAPWALWKWSLAAWLLRKRVLFLSVGAGTMEPRLTRFFLRSALRRAQYVSFRDERTARKVRALRLSSSRLIVPDLAFSHSARVVKPRSSGARACRIVLSPIGFLDPSSWPVKSAGAYESYVARTVELAGRLLERGFHVVLCTSDSPDIKTAEDIFRAASVIENHRPVSGTLELADTRDLADLLEQFRAADITIASRLHGLILANLLGTPTIALSYDWKVDEHMRVMSLEQYTFSVGSFEPSEVVQAVDGVLANAETVSSAIVDTCAMLATPVLRQYAAVEALVSGPVASPYGA